jgi:hypothetical protein
VPFSGGEVLGQSFNVMFRNLISFIVIGFTVFVPVFVLSYVIARGVETPEEARTADYAIRGLLLLMGFVIAGAVCYGVFRDLSGDRAGIGECLSVGLRRMLPVVVVAALWLLFVVLGLILLVIPGIIIACTLYVAVPASVVEAPGILGAFRRSVQLTAGHRWSIFAILFFLRILMFAGDKFTDAVAENAEPLVALIIILGVQFLLSLYWAVCAAVAYFHLRRDLEGIAIADLEDVFR